MSVIFWSKHGRYARPTVRDLDKGSSDKSKFTPIEKYLFNVIRVIFHL